MQPKGLDGSEPGELSTFKSSFASSMFGSGTVDLERLLWFSAETTTHLNGYAEIKYSLFPFITASVLGKILAHHQQGFSILCI